MSFNLECMEWNPCTEVDGLIPFIEASWEAHELPPQIKPKGKVLQHLSREHCHTVTDHFQSLNMKQSHYKMFSIFQF